MSNFPCSLPRRHGETAWTITGQHTGRKDIPLTEGGESNAQKLGQRLLGINFAKVYTSPLRGLNERVSWPGSSR